MQHNKCNITNNSSLLYDVSVQGLHLKLKSFEVVSLTLMSKSFSISLEAKTRSKLCLRNNNRMWCLLVYMPVAQESMESDNQIILIHSKAAALDVWSKIVQPS